mmetsp:Transcript_32236/g.74742  ORF Transcript_32236/g.74742 Transcript_32236/m.74742 type:complete len:281 (+) Transcript_32236:157-999(+)
MIETAMLPLLSAGLTGDQLEITMMPWYTGKFLPNGLYDAQKSSYYDTLTFPHLCALQDTMPQPVQVDSPALVRGAKFVACDMGHIQSPGGHSEATTQACAQQAGLDLASFQTCINSDGGYLLMRGRDFANKIHSVLDRTIDHAPYMFLNGEMLECPGFNFCASTWVPLGATGTYGHKPLPKAGGLLDIVCSLSQPVPAACASSGVQPAAVQPTPACENCAEVLPSGWHSVPGTAPGGEHVWFALAGAAAIACAAVGLFWRRTWAGCRSSPAQEELLPLED